MLGPGPGNPHCAEDVGRTLELARWAAGRVPVFGVCMGMQLLAVAAGGKTCPAAEVVHGKSVEIFHDGTKMFTGLPTPATMMRYNSLVVDARGLPNSWHVTATSKNHEVMAMEHRQWPLWAVQFHPESVGSPDGMRLLRNLTQMASEVSQVSPENDPNQGRC